MAYVNVQKAKDYPPTANAGKDQIIFLPQNYITLNGNASTDDKGIKEWEWTKGLDTQDLAVDMQVSIIFNHAFCHRASCGFFLMTYGSYCRKQIVHS